MKALAIRKKKKKRFFQDIKCSDSPFNRSKSKMQIKCIHIYYFTGCMTEPPSASGFIHQEEKLGKPAYICISIQIVPCLQALIGAKY